LQENNNNNNNERVRYLNMVSEVFILFQSKLIIVVGKIKI
jgi:hypothetical protein